MNKEFTNDEIKDAVRMARIYCPGFTEDKFESLMELERHIGDSGYLEAIQGLIRLEEEKGLSCTEALNGCKELLEKKTKLEQQIPLLKRRVESLIAGIKKANVEYEQVKKAIAKAKQELEEIRSVHSSAEKKLEVFNKRMEKEKQRIAKEVEECYQQANITRDEVVTAGQVKADVENHGFTLDLMLDLSKEFAGYKNAREKLAEGLKEHGSLSKYLDDLTNRGNKERTKVMADIAALESQKKSLAGENGQLSNVLSRLQADIAEEDALRHFHRRYVNLSGLIDFLTTWNQVYFMRCGNLMNTAAGVIDSRLGNPHFWTDRPSIVCPHCGCQQLFFDTDVYRYLNWPAEKPLKLTLGE